MRHSLALASSWLLNATVAWLIAKDTVCRIAVKQDQPQTNHEKIPQPDFAFQ